MLLVELVQLVLKYVVNFTNLSVCGLLGEFVNLGLFHFRYNFSHNLMHIVTVSKLAWHMIRLYRGLRLMLFCISKYCDNFWIFKKIHNIFYSDVFRINLLRIIKRKLQEQGLEKLVLKADVWVLCCCVQHTRYHLM